MFSQYLRSLLLCSTLSTMVAGLSAAQSPTVSPTVVKPTAGTIVGIVRDGAKAPVAGATVVATRTDGGSIRATVTGSDGLYTFADVAPGAWSISVEIDGAAAQSESALQVIASKATRYDFVMAGAPTAVAPAAALAATAPAGAAGTAGTAGTGAALAAGASAAPAARVAGASATPTAPSRAAGADVAPTFLSRVAGAFTSTAPRPAAAEVAQVVPEALQAPDAAPENDTVTPWADVGYIGWMNGNTREHDPIFDTKFFTPEIRFDANYLYDGNHPKDHTIVGSTEEFRSGEFQIEQVSFGGDFHWNGVKARFLSMMGLFSVTTPRNDASQNVGQWDLQGAYKYFSEANAGYHWDYKHGLNVDVGVFVSYIGLYSYYNFDNWTYQPSFVSSNTPWFFNGLRVQFWPTQHLKIEPWLINGWQSYAKFNSHPGFGGQILYIPNDSLKLVFNTYTLGQDNFSSVLTNGHPFNGGNPLADVGIYNPNAPYVDYSRVQRIHEDDSILVKYYDARGQNDHGITRAAFSLTVDVGCEYGGGVSCTGGPNKESFLGAMLYNRVWWGDNHYALTLGGGAYSNPGRYLALTPPINGATAATGSAYFTQQPGQKLFQYDAQLNFQYMPKDWITWWSEATFRHSNVPYWSGSRGITPPGAAPDGSAQGSGNSYGAPGSVAAVCNDGTAQGAGSCAADGGVWAPDLRTREMVFGAGVMVKF